MATKKTTTAKKAAPAKKKPASKPAKSSAPKKAVRTASPAKKTTAAKKTTKSAAPAKKAVKAVKVSAAEKKATGKSKLRDESLELALSAIRGIQEKKGQNILCLDLSKIENAVTKYFIICDAQSNTQVEAIADSVEQYVKKDRGQRPYKSEGWENALWILIDYIDVVVHVFEQETRHFYNLESLWADAEEVKF
jgi:ribosome-associated protein